MLIEASIEQEARATLYPSAHLTVRLPHAAVEPFTQTLTAPVPGERAGDVVMRSCATRAEDLSRPIVDNARRLAQVTDYRARLTALAARPDTSVDGLIKIAGQLSEVQAQIEAADADQLLMAQRMNTELVSVALRSDAATGGALAPLRETWSQGAVILGDSAGDALRFAIVALPWLPIDIIGLLLVRWIWRARRTRGGSGCQATRAFAVAPPTEAASAPGRTSRRGSGPVSAQRKSRQNRSSRHSCERPAG